jgi:hypothetical protein
MSRMTAAVLLVLLLAGSASGNFLEMEIGARALGMGGAFTAVADDVTALHWNPAGLALLEGFQVFGMRTSVYSVDGLSEDSVLASYGGNGRGYGVGWLRTGAADLYNEDTIVVGYGMEVPVEGLKLGAAVKRLSIDAPGYDYYNDPAFDGDGDAAFTGDLGALYHRGQWRFGAVYRNVGDPELSLISTTESPDAVASEFRLGGAYVFREVMLMTAEWRVPSEVPEYYDQKSTLNLGAEIWFYDAFALRTGMNRDRITAGVGLKAKNVQIDLALLSERRIGSLYRLSAMLSW